VPWFFKNTTPNQAGLLHIMARLIHACFGARAGIIIFPIVFTPNSHRDITLELPLKTRPFFQWPLVVVSLVITMAFLSYSFTNPKILFYNIFLQERKKKTIYKGCAI
jgi:hypothetical protein